jgi:uroporphyrinogen-III decarboxylase
MNHRERYIETLTFGSPDKVPFNPGGPRESTLRAWHEQGLPEGANYMEVIYDTLGFRPEPSTPGPGVWINFQMIPTFEEKVIEHKDGHYIVQDWMGAITEISDEFDYTYIRSARDFVTRKWHKFPVENRDDWEKMKWRFDPETPQRRPQLSDADVEALKSRDYLAAIGFNGPFWQLREWCGMEGLCMLMIEEPDLVMEMTTFWTEFVSATMRPVIERVQIDNAHMSEDMAYKAHSMISPAMTRKFLQPSYDRWCQELKAAGCPVIDMDSDGYIGELIPIWIESGINVCDPIEVAAHNDIAEFRRMFGTKMGYTGGIDKRAIAKGGKVIEAEMARVIPPLFEQGGFIPGCDHGVPPDISWPNFVEYSRLLAKYCGWI